MSDSKNKDYCLINKSQTINQDYKRDDSQQKFKTYFDKIK